MKSELRLALLFAAVSIAGMYLHEIGHALFGLAQGVVVVPTPAKEYELQAELEWRQMTWIALGGVLVSAVLAGGTILWYVSRRAEFAEPILAGILVVPGLYSLRFMLTGRGHDGLEFQEAQSALGFNPSGHAFDVIFLVLFGLGCTAMALRHLHKFNRKTLFRVLGYGIVGVFLLVAVQVANNALFDQRFPKTRTLHVPPGLEREAR